MKLGQLIKYNIRNNFLEKSYRKCGGKSSRRPFKNIKIGHIFGSTVRTVKTLFIVCFSLGLPKYSKNYTKIY